jgi:hypothetical protein
MAEDAVLSLTMAGWCLAATTTTTTPDIPKMAAAYVKDLGLSGSEQGD